MGYTLFAPLALGSNIARGYPLEDALAMTREAGFEYTEIASIVGSCEHLKPEEMNAETAAGVKALLERYRLKTYAFSGHGDLTDEKQLDDFLIKMRFASAVGAKIINTNSGPLSRKAEFWQAIRKIIPLAEELNLTVCLESHGDIIDTAKNAAQTLREIGHPLIRLNYDTGNAYYHAWGGIDLAEDLKYGLPYLAHIHLKDICLEGDRAYYRPIGAGDLDFRAIFQVLRSLGKPVPCGLEIPVYMQGTRGALAGTAAPLPRESIAAAVETSLRTIEELM